MFFLIFEIQNRSKNMYIYFLNSLHPFFFLRLHPYSTINYTVF